MDFFRRLFSSPPEPEKKSPGNEPPPEPVNAQEVRAADPPAEPVSPPVQQEDGSTRRLPPETMIAVSNAHLTFGQASDVGTERTENEDAVLSWLAISSSDDDLPAFGIFIIADGMGGHEFGEKASAMTVRTVAAEITQAAYVPIVSGKDMQEMPPISEILVSAFEKANSAVFTRLGGQCGTTCTTVVVIGDRAYLGHVGDSRAYLITKDSIEQLTRDHSVIQRLIELGQLTSEEALTHSRRNELYRTLGFKDTVEVDVMSRRLPSRSSLLVCTDGIWNVVKDDDIMSIVQKNASPQDACNQLIALANSRGANDNVSVVLLRTN